MRFVKPILVSHKDSKGNRNAIYSVDISGDRIATAGGGICKLFCFLIVLQRRYGENMALDERLVYCDCRRS